ncbi:uncharacterized protein CDV56_100298 [Aspergillus thermomutatus]|uniref:Uncharacterized protein n=1 Tax=Aspergillus thermomutatus TaxID=41047 RepID=A0A397G5H9_ASPTH|nr:uncharacterized protein CDV56_100298 [Aspergillus thermomutatus]RHZ43400.1 hypothetical protein CDV56_100298 [Aspergillus thermomutatus]
MSGPGDFDHLSGTRVIFDKGPQTWVLDEKIAEDYQTMSQDEVDDGIGNPYAAIKFACHNAADPNQKGILRIYIQIPITGTIARGPGARAQQAIAQRTHMEGTVLQSLTDKGCKVVPKLLGYQESNQDDEGCVPGGYINYIVWACVPGESIRAKEFWDRDRKYRDEVREKFRESDEELKKFGWSPRIPHLGNIIFDEATKALHISGFCFPKVLDSSQPFTDVTYAGWGLVKRSQNPDWYLNSKEWEW